jgi:NADPH:quinone reductase-like Zn-dependent oxidoreductase
LLEYYASEEQFGNVAGMENLKQWLIKRNSAFSQKATRFGLPAPRGVLLLGVQGCGKSLCAKAISSLWKMPLLRFDVGRMFGSLVGSSEENIRRAIQTAESVAPAILWVDEIDKAFAGSTSSGGSDGGTAARVFGSLLPFGREGTFADFLVVSDDRVLPIPQDLDAGEAAALPVAGGTALQALTDEAHVGPGQRVLITGAAGGVGHFAVQIAKHLGAYVVGVCSEANAAFVRELGADEVVDYAHDDYTRRSDRFDVVFDAASVSTFDAASRVLTPSGVYISTGGNATALLGTVGAAVFARLTSRQRAIPMTLRNDARIWQRVLQLVRDRAIKVHIARTISLEEVAEAQRAMETGHGRGKIVVRLG